MQFRPLLAIMLGTLISASAFAQTAPPTRIRGTIAGLDGRVLSVTTREGPVVKITLDEKYGVAAMKKVDRSEIAAGKFIGVAALPGPNGAWRALEVVVIPEAGRGSGEGHYPWDLTPESTMTNATVGTVVTSADGASFTMTYKGGSVQMIVPDGIPIVAPTGADVADVKPGAKVFVGASKAADGSFTAARVLVEKDGVAPPL